MGKRAGPERQTSETQRRHEGRNRLHQTADRPLPCYARARTQAEDQQRRGAATSMTMRGTEEAQTALFHAAAQALT